MTILTVDIPDQKDLLVLREILNRFGLNYTLDTDDEFQFSEAEIQSLLKSKKDFLKGDTTARSWSDIEEDLNRAYN